MEVLYVKLGVDPINGLMIIDSGDIHSLPSDLKQALVVTHGPIIVKLPQKQS